MCSNTLVGIRFGYPPPLTAADCTKALLLTLDPMTKYNNWILTVYQKQHHEPPSPSVTQSTWSLSVILGTKEHCVMCDLHTKWLTIKRKQKAETPMSYIFVHGTAANKSNVCCHQDWHQQTVHCHKCHTSTLTKNSCIEYTWRRWQTCMHTYITYIYNGQ
jgi:hypothetical protein